MEPTGLLLESDEIPESWRARAVRVWFIRLAPDEADQLLRREDPKLALDPEDEAAARLVALGMPAKAIAHELGIGTRAVYRRLSRLRERFGAGSIPELVAELARLGVGGKKDDKASRVGDRTGSPAKGRPRSDKH